MKEKVSYGGKVFTRDPDSKYSSHRYYRGQVYNRKTGKKRWILLHRIIWQDNFGAIPTGFLIRHKDQNPGNNEISNLECISEFQHLENNRNLMRDSMNVHYSVGGVSSGN